MVTQRQNAAPFEVRLGAPEAAASEDAVAGLSAATVACPPKTIPSERKRRLDPRRAHVLSSGNFSRAPHESQRNTVVAVALPVGFGPSLKTWPWCPATQRDRSDTRCADKSELFLKSVLGAYRSQARAARSSASPLPLSYFAVLGLRTGLEARRKRRYHRAFRGSRTVRSGALGIFLEQHLDTRPPAAKPPNRPLIVKISSVPSRPRRPREARRQRQGREPAKPFEILTPVHGLLLIWLAKRADQVIQPVFVPAPAKTRPAVPLSCAEPLHRTGQSTRDASSRGRSAPHPDNTSLRGISRWRRASSYITLHFHSGRGPNTDESPERDAGWASAIAPEEATVGTGAFFPE